MSMNTVLQQSWLGFPLSVIADSELEAARLVMNGLNPLYLEKLFFRTFLNALKNRDKVYRPLLVGVKGILIKEKEKLFQLFTANTEHFSEFYREIDNKEFHEKMAEFIVWEFSLEGNLLPVMTLIVRDALAMYKEAFLKMI